MRESLRSHSRAVHGTVSRAEDGPAKRHVAALAAFFLAFRFCFALGLPAPAGSCLPPAGFNSASTLSSRLRAAWASESVESAAIGASTNGASFIENNSPAWFNL